MRKDKLAVVYRGMEKSQMRAAVTIDLGDVMIEPEKTFFADYVSVTEARDGVALLFGKLGPEALSEGNMLRALLEVSFPFQHFYAQLYRSIVNDRVGEEPRTFLSSVQNAVALNGYEHIQKVEPVTRSGSEKYAAIRANAATIAIFGDDTSTDFFHLDAQTLRSIQAGKRPNRVPGLMRITMSACLLLYFCERVIAMAEALKEKRPTLGDEQSALQIGGPQ